jgi:hypothetical protein
MIYMMIVNINETYYAENWCKELNLELKGLLCKTETGQIFEVFDNKIIKFTSDFSEFINAFSILNKKFEHHVTIFDLKIFHNDTLAILMEKVHTNGIDKLFFELEHVALNKELPILSIDFRHENVSREARKLYLDVKRGISEIRSFGHKGEDINSGNIGYRDNGNYVLFDQTENLIFDDFLKLEKVEDCIKNNCHTNNKKILKKINAEDLMLNKNLIYTALKETNGLKMTNNSNISCFINSFGEIELSSESYNLFIQNILIGNVTFNAQVSKISESNLDSSPCKIKFNDADRFDSLIDNIVKIERIF